MSFDFNDAAKKNDAEASFQQKQLYQVQIAVKSLIDFVVLSFEELGIEKLHELTNPTLDELHDVILELDTKAKELGDIDLQQVLLTAQIMIRDIKQKNPDLCAQSSHILKNTRFFK